MRKNNKPSKPIALNPETIRVLRDVQIEQIVAGRGGATNVPTGGCGNYTCDG